MRISDWSSDVCSSDLVVLNIGIMAIAAYIGAGGLGVFISRGISQTDPRQLITGAVSVSLLAIIADYALLWLQNRLVPAGLKHAPDLDSGEQIGRANV